MRSIFVSNNTKNNFDEVKQVIVEGFTKGKEFIRNFFLQKDKNELQ